MISSLTAAQMRQMMQRVVLSPHGTGRRAMLERLQFGWQDRHRAEGRSCDRTLFRTKYVASFAGSPRFNNPAVTIAVVLDSACGLASGRQVFAPRCSTIAQQVLEYLHTPHDTEIPASRQTLLARAKTNEKELEEGSPDHPGESLDDADSSAVETVASAKSTNSQPTRPSAAMAPPSAAGIVVPASLRHAEFVPPSQESSVAEPVPISPSPQPVSGTVVIDVEQGGIVVPSFAGKSLRSSIELAQNSGLELEIVGSGRALDQSPAPGSHVASGARITVKFGR